jgi:DNA-binding SARP family transcriptional activator
LAADVQLASGSSEHAVTETAAGLRFEVLGPVRAWNNDTELDLGSPQQRAVLAILLLSQGRQVSRDILVDAIWGAEPPRSAVGTVRTYISRLRRCLDPVTGYRASELLTTVGDGYAIATGEVTVDAELFTRQVQQAQLTRSGGDLALAARQLGAALALCRGVPLAGIQGPYADSQRARLQELRMAVTEDGLSMDIESGGHLNAIGELLTLLAEHPLREKLSELLMLALYRAGRQADALAVFADVRRLLRDELGIDPGPGLRDMHERILRADASLIAHADDGRPGPAIVPPSASSMQLPPVHADVTGRAEMLGTVVATLTDSPAAPVVAITGMPGIGKTALAIQAAHAVRAAFPGGQLYAELADGAPAGPSALLAGWQETLEHGDGRVLVVLDGVRDAAQARQLIDAVGGCAVIITTQRRMIDLPGVRWFEVGPLNLDDSIHLLERLIGRERVADERAGAEWVVALCAGQPIAIRTAAARLVARPAWKIAAMARQLAEELSQPVPTHADCELVEAPFELAYQQLTDAQAVVFRQAAMSDSPEVSVAEVAARTGLPEHSAFAILESLADVHLARACAFGSYRYDPLVKLYAQRKALAEDAPPVR